MRRWNRLWDVVLGVIVSLLCAFPVSARERENVFVPVVFPPMRWRLLAQAVWRMNGPREKRFIRCTGPLGNRRRTERAPRGLKCENTAGYAPLSTSESTDGNALLRNVTS